MRERDRRRSGGYSLLELIAVVAIFGMVMGAITAILIE
ncbi:MAG: prepilin-type N-terminal cleavage/methylation domain-containing protein, partial [Planctomycetota bacterium]